MEFLDFIYNSHTLIDEINKLSDTEEDKLKKQYHYLTQRINNLHLNIKQIDDIDLISAFYDGIKMYEKIRLSIFKKLRYKNDL